MELQGDKQQGTLTALDWEDLGASIPQRAPDRGLTFVGLQLSNPQVLCEYPSTSLEFWSREVATQTSEH